MLQPLFDLFRWRHEIRPREWTVAVAVAAAFLVLVLLLD
jgi:hypothetical protein